MALASECVQSLSHELSLDFGKVSLDQYEKGILYSRLAIPLISEAEFLFRFAHFCFYYEKLDTKLLVQNK